MDFDDLLLRTNELLTRFPEVLAKYQDRFRYILVDEYQAETAVESLRKEFEKELKSGIVSQIYSIDNLAVIGLVTDNFQKILSELQKNKIFPLLLNQVASAGRVNLVVSDNQLDKVILA